jgi:hypothetical protein
VWKRVHVDCKDCVLDSVAGAGSELLAILPVFTECMFLYIYSQVPISTCGFLLLTSTCLLASTCDAALSLRLSTTCKDLSISLSS